MPAPLKISLRPMLPEDGPELAALFAASIDELTGADYSAEQQAAWIASAEDDAAFTTRLQEGLTILALADGVIAGFASLKGKDTLDMLYVRPDLAGQGVGTALCDALERIAQGRGAASLTTAASDTAQPFFSKRGFEALHRETVSLGDEWLGRTLMRKQLAEAATAPETTRH